MIVNLAQNIPQLIGHYEGVVSIYIKQYGTGNLRISSDRESIVTGAGTNAPGQIVDGIAQATAAGFVQYFWSGDLWVISDQAGPAVIIAPANQTYIQRDLTSHVMPSDVTMPSEEDGNLSTYSVRRKNLIS